MRKAAEKMEFEKAAELRNMMTNVRQTTKRAALYRGTLPSAIDPLAMFRRSAMGCSFPHCAVMECFDISNISHHPRGRLDGVFPRWRAG